LVFALPTIADYTPIVTSGAASVQTAYTCIWFPRIQLYRRVREDLLSQGIASQTPAITGSPMLARRPIAQFFEPPAPEEIADLAATPAFNVYLEANRYQFVSGEQMQLGIESELDGYLYIFDVDPERKVTQLFPNEFESDNRLPAGKQAKVPGPRA